MLRSLLERPRGVAAGAAAPQRTSSSGSPATATARAPSLARTRSFAAAALRHAMMDSVLDDHLHGHDSHHGASAGGSAMQGVLHAETGPHTPARPSRLSGSRQHSVDAGVRDGAVGEVGGDEEQGGVAGGDDVASTAGAASEHSTQPETINSSLLPAPSSSIPVSIGGATYGTGTSVGHGAAAAAAAADERLMRRCFERALDMFDTLKIGGCCMHGAVCCLLCPPWLCSACVSLLSAQDMLQVQAALARLLVVAWAACCMLSLLIGPVGLWIYAADAQSTPPLPCCCALQRLLPRILWCLHHARPSHSGHPCCWLMAASCKQGAACFHPPQAAL